MAIDDVSHRVAAGCVIGRRVHRMRHDFPHAPQPPAADQLVGSQARRGAKGVSRITASARAASRHTSNTAAAGIPTSTSQSAGSSSGAFAAARSPGFAARIQNRLMAR
jgi:formate dehydrogenase assembly factor FdhD